jgi:hypothetical protein
VEGDDQGSIPKTMIGNVYTMNKVFDKKEIKIVIMNAVKIHRI